MIVLFVDHAAGLGGAERSLLLLLANLDRQSVQPELVTPGGPLAEAARALGIPVHIVEMPRLRRSATAGRDAWRSANALANVALRRGARLIHANTVRAAFYSAMAAQISETPWLWHMRDFWLSESEPAILLLDKTMKGLLGQSAWRVVANSRAVAATLPFQINVIYNGIDVGAFTPQSSSQSFRQQWSIPNNEILIGMVGRLRPWKGHQSFLQMAAEIAKQHATARFVIVGGTPLGSDTDYVAHLKQQVAKEGLADRVTFTGQVEDVRPALAAMDIFVHPGQPEPFGLVTTEAMAMSNAIVAFAHGANPELIVEGHSGLLAAPHDVMALADNVMTLINNEQQRRILGAHARERVARYFDIRRTALEMTALYQQLAPYPQSY